jgi:hypothetical protein
MGLGGFASTDELTEFLEGVCDVEVLGPRALRGNKHKAFLRQPIPKLWKWREKE